MELALPKTIAWDAALRYLGAAGDQSGQSLALLHAAGEQLFPACTPRGVWRPLPLAVLGQENIGLDLARHLAGCGSLVLMAVTLGPGPDRLLRRLCLTDIALGAAADALASAVLETLCDTLETEIRAETRAGGRYLTGRYSPGYGDCPLELQTGLCLALDTVRGMGMSPTAAQLLVPGKSVTAVLGVADHPVTGARAGCEHCRLAGKCEYRKRGTTCAEE